MVSASGGGALARSARRGGGRKVCSKHRSMAHVPCSAPGSWRVTWSAPGCAVASVRAHDVALPPRTPSAGRQRPARSGIIVSRTVARGARGSPRATAPLHLFPEEHLMTIENEKVVTVHYHLTNVVIDANH